MLVTNAIARGRDAASSRSLRAVFLGPRAVHGFEGKGYRPHQPRDGPFEHPFWRRGPGPVQEAARSGPGLSPGVHFRAGFE